MCSTTTLAPILLLRNSNNKPTRTKQKSAILEDKSSGPPDFWYTACQYDADSWGSRSIHFNAKALSSNPGLRLEKDPWKPRGIPDLKWPIFIRTTFGDFYTDISSDVSACQFLYGQWIRPSWAINFAFLAVFCCFRHTEGSISSWRDT